MSNHEVFTSGDSVDFRKVPKNGERVDVANRAVITALTLAALALGSGDRNRGDVRAEGVEGGKTRIGQETHHESGGLADASDNIFINPELPLPDFDNNRVEMTDGLQEENPLEIELMQPETDEEKELYADITRLMGGGTRFGQPVRTADFLPFANHGWSEQPNFRLEVAYLKLIKEALLRMPPSMMTRSHGEGTSYPDIFYMLYNNAQCTCGANGGMGEVNYAYETIQRGIPLDYGIPGHLFMHDFAQNTMVKAAHEWTHSVERSERNRPLFMAYIETVGWVRGSDGKWTTLDPKEMFPTVDVDFRRGPTEAIADVISFLVADKKNFLLYPPLHQVFLVKYYPDWEYLWSDPDNAAKRDEILAKMGRKIFLPIVSSNIPIEEEGNSRANQPVDLSDARRFRPITRAGIQRNKSWNRSGR